MGKIDESYNFVKVWKIMFFVCLSPDISFAKARPTDEANISVHCSNLRCSSNIAPCIYI